MQYILWLLRSCDEIYKVQVHSQWARYILDNLASNFLDCSNLVHLVDIFIEHIRRYGWFVTTEIKPRLIFHQVKKTPIKMPIV